MFGIVNYGTFLISGILLNLTPGTDTMYILARSISQGKKAGIVSVLGISTGIVCHIILVTLGLSVILAKSDMAFTVVKYMGAVYLVFLGIQNIVKKKGESFELNHHKESFNYKKIYISGILTNVLNPKVALFFLAFLPQFIDPDYTESCLPFLILGATFLLTSTAWSMVLAVFASKISEAFRKNDNIKKYLDTVTGVLFIGIGIKLALAKK